MDWKTMARAVGAQIPQEDLERVTAPLVALEPVFQKITATLSPSVEPAIVFDPAAGEEAAE